MRSEKKRKTKTWSIQSQASQWVGPVKLVMIVLDASGWELHANINAFACDRGNCVPLA